MNLDTDLFLMETKMSNPAAAARQKLKSEGENDQQKAVPLSTRRTWTNFCSSEPFQCSEVFKFNIQKQECQTSVCCNNIRHEINTICTRQARDL